MHKETFHYIDNNTDRFLTELSDFLRFPSISAQSSHTQDIIDCAQWLRNHLQSLGLEAIIVETNGHPIVTASNVDTSSDSAATPAADPNEPTPIRKVIFYGHYDVQPEDPLDEWQTDPFTPVIKDGFICARGATDDKGQLFAHVKAVETLLRTQGQLPCCVEFLIEGEEECGGSSLANYVTSNKDKLSCDAVVISDTAMHDEHTPALTYGLRGIAGFEVTITGPQRDVHSGSFGGAIANPATQLCHIISQCIDSQGTILIPHFYDDVREPDDWETANLEKLAQDDTKLARQLSIPRTFGEPGFSTLARIGSRPTFEINGIHSGYAGPGSKTIIPATASAKITMRLVPNQDWRKTAQLAIEHIRSVCSDAVTLEISKPFGANTVLFDVTGDIVQAASSALTAGFGRDPVFIREGGSIPVVETFSRELNVPVLLMGLGLNTDGAHSPNERFKITNFINGIKSSAALLMSL